MWWLYELLLIVAYVLYVPSAVWRRRLPHRGWSMRLGWYPRRIAERLAGRRSLWVHAVSVGETLSARPLVRELARRHPQQPIVLSTITKSGFAVAAPQVAEVGAAVYFPLDLRVCAGRALSTLQPAVLIFMESEFWPIVVRSAKARGIPIVVVNGRISPRAYRRYRLVAPLMAATLRRIDVFLMQAQADADRAIALGAPRNRVRVVGSLKWDASVGARPSDEDVRALAARLGVTLRDRVIVAGSTHRGEEAAVLRAFTEARQTFPFLRLIAAPRHLERLAEVEGLIRQAGFSPVRLSRVAATEAWVVGVVDTFGELPRYYALANLVFIGGSLIPHGGQNPLEAASLAKPIIFGPHMHNFADIAQQLLADQAAWQVRGSDELPAAVTRMLMSAAEAQAMGRRALELTERSQGALARTLEALQSFAF